VEATLSVFPTHIEIAGRRIGPGEPCYIIAEAGVSHFGEIEKAYQLIQMAVDARVDVFKTQHYSTELLVGPTSPEWRKRLEEKELPDEAIALMQKRCNEAGIPFLCTPHEEKALAFLNDLLNIPAIKVGSGEIKNWPFLAKVASCKKPVILSTGMYQIQDIKDAISVLSDAGCAELAILHCVTSYPAEPELINLRVMDQIRSFFNGPVGYSDHTEGTAIPLAAVSLGANIIEKHITIDLNVPNAQDWKVSCHPENFSNFIKDIRKIERSLGDGVKKISDKEELSRMWAQKSITVFKEIKKGEVITPDKIIIQRPGTGIDGSFLDTVIGKKAVCDLDVGVMINNTHFS
jgi:N-acetylneuraminate synthase/N,N'-diacetyllegionaminate synthase